LVNDSIPEKLMEEKVLREKNERIGWNTLGGLN